MVIYLPVAAETGTQGYDWVGPDGVVRSMSGNATGINVLAGESGLGMPAIELIDDKLPFSSGVAIRHAAIGAKMIELPLELSAVSASALEALFDAAYRMFATADERSRTPGYLRVRRRDGTTRQVACYYAGGLEGDRSPDRSGETWQDVVVTFKAADPYATDVADTVLSYAVADLPINMINPGTMDAQPIWSLFGSFGTVEIENETTGKSWKLAVALNAPRSLAVDTRLPNQRPYRQAYATDTLANLFPFFVKPFSLFPLAPGQNRMTVTFSGSPATDSSTAVILTYRARYHALSH